MVAKYAAEIIAQTAFSLETRLGTTPVRDQSFPLQLVSYFFAILFVVGSCTCSEHNTRLHGREICGGNNRADRVFAGDTLGHYPRSRSELSIATSVVLFCDIIRSWIVHLFGAQHSLAWSRNMRRK